MLIDNGSTHKFIQLALAERLNINILPTNGFRVYIGNGDSLVCQHKCVGVLLDLQGITFTIDIFVLPIQGPEII